MGRRAGRTSSRFPASQAPGQPFGIGLDPQDPDFSTVDGVPYSQSAGLYITYCFLDGDPVDTAPLLQVALEKRWADSAVVPLFAAPFYPVVGRTRPVACPGRPGRPL